MKTISCYAPYGHGGLGQHFAQMVEDARREGQLAFYFGKTSRPGDEAISQPLAPALIPLLLNSPPIRFSKGWRDYLSGDVFDRAVAHHLKQPTDLFIGFVGKSLHSFRRARKIGFGSLGVMAANSHVNNIKALHAQATAQHGIERSWLLEPQRRKTLQEYAEADIIYVGSDYSRATFLREGVPASKLRKLHFDLHPRFVPPSLSFPEDGVFRIVYTGSLTVQKGLPVLLEAFARLGQRDATLTLVGGWSSRAMRKYMQQWLSRDARIRHAPGDPLPHLQQADVYVHPSYEDGFAYAPMEALACGVPVIVTEDTGMKEHVREGVSGFVVPTGDVDALVERLEHVQRNPFRPPLPQRNTTS